MDGKVLPPVVFIHGTEDSIAHVEGMDLFVELVRKHKAVAGMKEEGGEGGREEERTRGRKKKGEGGGAGEGRGKR